MRFHGNVVVVEWYFFSRIKWTSYVVYINYAAFAFLIDLWKQIMIVDICFMITLTVLSEMLYIDDLFQPAIYILVYSPSKSCTCIFFSWTCWTMPKILRFSLTYWAADDIVAQTTTHSLREARGKRWLHFEQRRF